MYTVSYDVYIQQRKTFLLKRLLYQRTVFSGFFSIHCVTFCRSCCPQNLTLCGKFNNEKNSSKSSQTFSSEATKILWKKNIPMVIILLLFSLKGASDQMNRWFLASLIRKKSRLSSNTLACWKLLEYVGRLVVIRTVFHSIIISIFFI